MKRKRAVIKFPLCLNPKYQTKGLRNYINTCEISDRAKKDMLLEEYLRTKRARINKEDKDDRWIARVMHTLSAALSSLFRASFANGAVESEVMAYQGAMQTLYQNN